jgi:hypothetical protein
VSDTLEALWRSGHWLDLAIAITVLELLVLAVWRRRTGSLRWSAHAWNLLAGLWLMVALRLVLSDAHWMLAAACLAAAGLAHAVDLRNRLRAN